MTEFEGSTFDASSDAPVRSGEIPSPHGIRAVVAAMLVISITALSCYAIVYMYILIAGFPLVVVFFPLALLAPTPFMVFSSAWRLRRSIPGGRRKAILSAAIMTPAALSWSWISLRTAFGKIEGASYLVWSPAILSTGIVAGFLILAALKPETENALPRSR